MFRRFSVTFAIFSLFLDGLIAGFSLVAAFSFRPLLNGLPFAQHVPNSQDPPVLLSILFPVIWMGILMIFSVYDGRKNLRAVDEFSSLTGGALLASIAMAGVLYFSFRDVSRLLFVTYCLQTYLLLIFWRVAARLVFRWRVPGLAGLPSHHRVLILGAGEGGRRLSRLIQGQPALGLELVGLLDDDPQKQEDGARLLGPLDALRQAVGFNNVDDVVVALPRSASERLNWVVSELHDLPVRVWVIPDYFSLALHRATVEEFAGIPMLDLRAPALDEYQHMTKRAFDLVVTFLSLLWALPLSWIIAAAIKLDSPGPVIYTSRRVGQNGRLFPMFKFRTMVCNADALRHLVDHYDQDGNLVFKSPDDPRVTRVGRFLRRSSLDELPQLLNVLRGEMSLVGPRPELPDLVDKYLPWQRKRFAVPQGMTGWWQIHGRSDKPMHLHTEEDLYYVQHYSIWLDLQILIQTVWVVLRGKGAY